MMRDFDDYLDVSVKMRDLEIKRSIDYKLLVAGSLIICGVVCLVMVN